MTSLVMPTPFPCCSAMSSVHFFLSLRVQCPPGLAAHPGPPTPTEVIFLGYYSTPVFLHPCQALREVPSSYLSFSRCFRFQK